MKKKIKSAVISIVVIAVLLLAILIGVKNGTLDKLTKEMPTLATNQVVAAAAVAVVHLHHHLKDLMWERR